MSWQLCQVYFLRNLMMRVRKSDRGLILAAMKDLFNTADKATAETRLRDLVTSLRKPYPQLAE